MSGQYSVRGGVLVTGARGFVGSHLCLRLAARGWRVLAASRGPHTNKLASGMLPITLPALSGVDEWQTALSGIDCVVHLAARVHQPDRSPEDAAAFRIANVAGSLFVAEQAARAGVRRLVYLSSIKVNGEGGTLQPYVADDPPCPKDNYGRSKLESEEGLRSVCMSAGVELVIIRPPLVYGPGVRANFARLLGLVASGIPLPLRSVRNRRSMVSVANLADFIELCIEHPAAAHRTWLVSDGQDLSTPQLIERLAHFMNRSARLFPCRPSLLRRVGRLVGFEEEIARLCDPLVVDISAARSDLGWTPPQSVDEGLACTVAAYRRPS